MTGPVRTSSEVTFRHAEPVMGTVVSFVVHPRGLPYERTRAALDEACRVLHHADETFSLYRPESPLSRLRRGEQRVADCPPEVAAVLGLCWELRSASGGWFDPWALPGGVDPTGLVKGWAAQQAADVLRAAGVGAAMVNAAGDLVVFGQPAAERRWRVGVRSSQAADRLACVVDADGAVATSGNYERRDHVRDPHTGQAASAAISATVCGADLAYADAFATGLLAAGEAGLASVLRFGYEALLVLPDGRYTHTPGFPLVQPG